MPYLTTTPVTRICFVRHGETDWNVERRIQGHTDILLNATGRAQALAMAYNAAHISFRALYSSGLQRAVETKESAYSQIRRARFRLLPVAMEDDPGRRSLSPHEHQIARRMVSSSTPSRQSRR